ncbi:MAG: hypothetical protein V1844_18745 [Pseudomonadota bacterium]
MTRVAPQAFLHAIRRQLLMWRSLDSAAHDHYEKLLADALDKS